MRVESQSAVAFALERYQVSPGIDYVGATYNEMVASGSLTNIKNQELKRSISDTFSALGSFNEKLQSFRASMPIVDDIVWKNVAYSLQKDNRRPVATFDLTEICDKAEVRNAFVEMIDIQSDGLDIAISALELVVDLAVRLSENGAQATL